MKTNISRLCIVMLISMIYISGAYSQKDTLKVGDVVTAERIRSLNDWRACYFVSSEEQEILDSLDMFSRFYDRVINYYAKNSKCIFLHMCKRELRSTERSYKLMAEKLYDFRTYREKIGISSEVVSDALYRSILREIKYDCDYFSNVTKEERSNVNSGFNQSILSIFGSHEYELISLLENERHSEYHKKNLSIILRSLDLLNDKEQKGEKYTSPVYTEVKPPDSLVYDFLQGRLNEIGRYNSDANRFLIKCDSLASSGNFSSEEYVRIAQFILDSEIVAGYDFVLGNASRFKTKEFMDSMDDIRGEYPIIYKVLNQLSLKKTRPLINYILNSDYLSRDLSHSDLEVAIAILRMDKFSALSDYSQDSDRLKKIYDSLD